MLGVYFDWNPFCLRKLPIKKKPILKCPIKRGWASTVISEEPVSSENRASDKISTPCSFEIEMRGTFDVTFRTKIA